MPVDVSTALPDLDLQSQALLTVDTGDPGALITQMVIHVSQDIPPALLATLPQLLAVEPNT